MYPSSSPYTLPSLILASSTEMRLRKWSSTTIPSTICAVGFSAHNGSCCPSLYLWERGSWKGLYLGGRWLGEITSTISLMRTTASPSEAHFVHFISLVLPMTILIFWVRAELWERCMYKWFCMQSNQIFTTDIFWLILICLFFSKPHNLHNAQREKHCCQTETTSSYVLENTCKMKGILTHVWGVAGCLFVLFVLKVVSVRPNR